MVQMKNLLTGNIWLWDRGKFVNRRYLMQVSISKLIVNKHSVLVKCEFCKVHVMQY